MGRLRQVSNDASAYAAGSRGVDGGTERGGQRAPHKNSGRGGEVCTAGLQGASTRRDVGEDEHGRATSERTTTTGITITNNTHAGTQARANANERTNNNNSDNDNK